MFVFFYQIVMALWMHTILLFIKLNRDYKKLYKIKYKIKIKVVFKKLI